MKKFNKLALMMLLLVVLFGGTKAFAATSPSLGSAGTFFILSDSYTNTVGTTTVAVGDIGYTTQPATAVLPSGGGVIHVADATYNQAGIDQAKVLAYLNSEPCTFNFAPGPINLSTDTTHGTALIYAPGVYCMAGAATIGTAGITLSGAGTYIFKMDGALTSVANSAVRFVDGATQCDLWWIPTAATTLGANSTFAGTDIDASGITIGDTVNWTGAALAFGGTVSTLNDTLVLQSCTARTAAVPVRAVAVATATATTTVTAAPAMPNTGNNPNANNALWVIIISGGMAASLLSLYTILKKKRI